MATNGASTQRRTKETMMTGWKSSLTKLGRASALLMMMVALGALAQAETHKGIHTKLKITSPVQVGDRVLEPGDYEVMEVDSTSGPVLQFVHVFRNELASELVQADEEEIVARVKFSEKTLSAAAEHTGLRVETTPAEAVALEVKGRPVDYVLESPTMSAEGGMQE